MTVNPTGIGPAHDYLQRVIAALQAMDRREKSVIVTVLENLSNFVQGTRREIEELNGGDGRNGKPLNSANDYLEEIVAETMAATNAIMSAAEAIEAMRPKMDPATWALVANETTKIYEACSFQDITGQRISKVVHTLQQIESKLFTLSDMCRSEGDVPQKPGRSKPVVNGDAALLNGPQLGGEAQGQDEVDRLLASLDAGAA